MKIDNPFDKKIELNQSLPNTTLNGLVTVNGTLEFAWASAQSVFEERATPEQAIAICQMMLECIHRNQNKAQMSLNISDE